MARDDQRKFVVALGQLHFDHAVRISADRSSRSPHNQALITAEQAGETQ